ncbi:hypothetical protein DTW94_25185 [Streptomyces cavourensis]|uniref:Uncharacterized protein n=1 Tax=Streptomyces cavourensis TaxID=67258 RepID=A0AAD0Q8E2_9ACTN|nr:hypothetical protein DTW94_25185 [Streptomyces cavourensis]
MSGSPRYIQYRGDPPPCDRTHRTPPRLPFGQTTLLSTHALVPPGPRPPALRPLEKAAPPARPVRPFPYRTNRAAL